MRKLIVPILFLTAFGIQAFAQTTLSAGGAQSGVVSAPKTPAPAVQPPGTFTGGVSPAAPPAITPPQMPTTANPVGSPAPVSAPEPSSAPRTQLSAPNNQAGPAPAP